MACAFVHIGKIVCECGYVCVIAGYLYITRSRIIAGMCVKCDIAVLCVFV